MIRKDVIVEKDKKIVNLLQDFGFSFADVNKIVRKKDVKVNGQPAKINQTVLAGDKVTFFYSNDMLQKKFEIVEESEDHYIIYKFAGIESAGENGIENVLKDAIAVHRLDRNTEGLMVFAKNLKSAELLKKAFKEHKVHKIYVTEVVGKLETNKTYTAFLVKDSQNSNVKIFDKQTANSQKIETKIKTIKATEQSSVLQVELISGRTHQIRAHLAHLGHPIIGDGKYGKNEINKKFQENKQKLACFLLKFDYLGIDSLNFKEFERKPKWFLN